MAQNFAGGKGDFIAGKIHPLLSQADIKDGLSGRCVVGHLRGGAGHIGRRAVGRVEGIAVEQVGGAVDAVARQIFQGHIDLGGIAVDVGGEYLHADAVILTGAAHRLEELGRGGGELIKKVVGGGHIGGHQRRHAQGDAQSGGQYAQAAGAGKGAGPKGHPGAAGEYLLDTAAVFSAKRLFHL